MAILRLLPTTWSTQPTYVVHSETGATFTDMSNALTNVDSGTYGTIKYDREGYTLRVYFAGFDFSNIPTDKIIDGVTVKTKARVKSGITYAYIYIDSVDGEGTLSYMSPSPITFSNSEATTQTFGNTVQNSLSMSLPVDVDLLRKSNAFTIEYYRTHNEGVVTKPEFYVYGTEIDIEYHDHPKIFNLILAGKANYPTPVQEYTISKYPASYTTSGSIRGSSYQNAIGKGADTAAVSGNDYASSSGSTAYINYAFDFNEIPNTATIKSMTLQAKGHAESTSNSNRKSELQVYSGSTAKSAAISFTSTSAQTLTIDFTGYTMTVAELKAAVLRFTIGYYGGLVNGATWTVTYEA